MAQIYDLPEELMVEILSKVPLTSLKEIRCTSKKWYALSQNLILSKVEKPFLSFVVMDFKLCSIQFDLQGVHNDEEEVYPLIKKVALFEEIEISKVFHCDGLLLCVIIDNKGLLVWNPYLCETKWIQTRNEFHKSDRFALGYDKNRNHKILRLFSFGYEIYDLRYDSWSVYNLSPYWDREIVCDQCVVKGNSYFVSRKKRDRVTETKDILVCFDFTSGRFGSPLPLPFSKAYVDEILTMSCVGEDKLAVLHWHYYTDIWLTNKLDDDDPKETIMWSKFLKFPVPLNTVLSGSFFIDEEKEVAVVFDLGLSLEWYKEAHIIGEDGFYKSVNMGEALYLDDYCVPYVCSSYVPSLVHLQNTKTRKRKQRYE